MPLLYTAYFELSCWCGGMRYMGQFDTWKRFRGKHVISRSSLVYKLHNRLGWSMAHQEKKQGRRSWRLKSSRQTWKWQIHDGQPISTLSLSTGKTSRWKSKTCRHDSSHAFSLIFLQQNGLLLLLMNSKATNIIEPIYTIAKYNYGPVEAFSYTVPSNIYAVNQIQTVSLQPVVQKSYAY